MRIKPFNNVGQHITEYTLLIALVVAGVIVMGPYVKRSWNGQMRGWEVSVKDSVYDPLKQASAISIPVNCECSYNGGACVVGADEVLPNGDICQVRKKVFGVNCTPIGCPATIEPYCSSDYSNDCCGNFQALNNCGATNNLACCWGESNLPSGIPNPTSTPYYGQILRQKECGNPASPTIEYEWQPNTACDHRCLRSGAEDTSWFNGLPAYSGLCTGDDNEVPSQTEYTTVASTGCTDAVKCQVKCNTALGYIPGTASGFPVCKCPAGQTPNESGQCIAADRKKLDCVVFSGAFNVEIPECSGLYSEPLFYYQNSDCSTSPSLMTYYIEAWNRPNFCNQWYQGPTNGCGQGQFSEWKGRIKICCKPNVAPAVHFRCRVRSVQSRAYTSGGQSTGAQEPPCGYSHPSNIQCEERKWNTPPEAASAQGGALTNWLYFDRNVTDSKGGHRTKYCCNRTIGPAPDQMPSCTKIMVAGTASYASCDTLTPPSGDYYEELFHFCNNSNGNCGDKDIKYTICCTHSTMYYTPSSP